MQRSIPVEMVCPLCRYAGGGPSDHEPWCRLFMSGPIDLEGQTNLFDALESAEDPGDG